MDHYIDYLRPVTTNQVPSTASTSLLCRPRVKEKRSDPAEIRNSSRCGDEAMLVHVAIELISHNQVDANIARTNFLNNTLIYIQTL